MANKIIQATALPTGEQAQLILIDNGDGTFTQTVAFDRDTYPSRAADIVAGSSILVSGLLASAQMLFLPGPPIAVTLKQVYIPSLAATDNDLYTCPVGKRALAVAIVLYNTTGGGINVFAEIKISGVYFRLGATTSAGANALTGLGGTLNQPFHVLEAGESIALNAAAIGLNAIIKVFEYDAAIPLKTVRLNSLTAADNDLYTCPAGVQSHPLNHQSAGGLNFIQGTAIVNNATAGTPTYTGHVIKGAGASASTNQLGRAAALAVNASAVVAGLPILEAGDRVVITSSSAAAGQTAFVTVYELPM